ncbi:MAG: hypothetical protein J5972_04795, partial [Eubacterium sp.]|nr:hypothetical protein [Eubacterium sp.]
MYYEEDFVEEVRQRSDVVDVISSYVNLKRTGSNYVGLCPFHNEKTASFSVSPGKQMYYCFGCGAGGNVFTFLMEYENLTFVEALEQLAEKAGLELPKSSNQKEDRKKRDLRDSILEVYKLAANYYFAKLKSDRGKVGYDYLIERELKPETIVKLPSYEKICIPPFARIRWAQKNQSHASFRFSTGEDTIPTDT